MECQCCPSFGFCSTKSHTKKSQFLYVSTKANVYAGKEGTKREQDGYGVLGRRDMTVKVISQVLFQPRPVLKYNPYLCGIQFNLIHRNSSLL
jgi:hypothetical protein